MNIATKKRLNEAMKKPWEYMAKEYTFQAWDELNGKVIIATDLDSITVELDDLDMFLAGLIEVGAKKTDITATRSSRQWKHTNPSGSTL